MGCGGSKETTEAQPLPIKEVKPEPVPEPELKPKPKPEPTPEPEPEPEKGPGFLFTNKEEALDEVEIEDVLEDYPPPVPHTPQNNITLIKDADLLRRLGLMKGATQGSGREHTTAQNQHQITMEDVDKRARQVPISCLSSFADLTDYLCRDIRGTEDEDRLTVRALIVWLSVQEVEVFARKPANENTPEGYLSLLGQQRVPYSTFFTVLCRAANIKCVKIYGVSKAGDYEPGDDVSHIRDCWNSVYLKDSWYIIHPFWVCRSLVGHNAGGWIKLESGGKTIGKREEATTGYLRNIFKEYYYLPDPSEFGYYCHPNDQQWQLVEKPISREQFKDRAYVEPTFFTMGLKIQTEQTCVLTSNDGESLIQIQAPKKLANTYELWYDLYLKEGSASGENENEMLKAENMPRLVAMVRCGDHWNFQMAFPIAGTFKICIYGGKYSSTLSRVAEFRIDCKRQKENCTLLPVDPGRLGFGPGPGTEAVGLYVPSRVGGQIQVQKDKPVIIKFTMEQSVIKTTEVKVDLVSSTAEQHTTTASSQTASWEIREEQRELVVTTRVSVAISSVLAISVARKEPAQDDEEEIDTSNLDFQTVCNYLLSSNSPVYEKADKKNARKKLREILDTDNIDVRDTNTTLRELEVALNKCTKVKIADDDSDYVAGRTKYDCLKIRRDIHDVYMRRNVHVTQRTIHEIQNSEYLSLYQTDVQQLQEFQMHLESIGTYTQKVPSVIESITEMSRMTKVQEEVETVMRAFLTLTGEKGTLNTWTDILEILRRPSDHIQESVRQFVRTIRDRKCSKDDVEIADRYLGNTSVEAVQRISLAAARIYTWTRDLIDSLKDAPKDN